MLSNTRARSLRRLRFAGLLGIAASLAVNLSSAQEASLGGTGALPSGWTETLNRMVFYGDFRSRLEGDWNRPGASDRWRSRLRVRLGTNYSLSDNLLVGGRLSTGSRSDARDTNATNGDTFSKIDLSLDRLFLTWNPEAADPLFVTLGKFAHPFQRNPVYDELVWYSDVQPEGVVVGDTIKDVGPLDSLRGQAGYYIVEEKSRGNIGVAVAEVLASDSFADGSRGNLSMAWYGYHNAQKHSGSTTSEYQIVDVIAGLLKDIGGHPWRFSLEGLSNLSTSNRDGIGWAAGLSYGSAQKEGDWRAYYQYQEIGNDAVFSPVAGADFLIDHNFRGHVGNLDYLLTDDVTLRVRMLTSKPIDPDLGPGNGETAYRLRLELNVKF